MLLADPHLRDEVIVLLAEDFGIKHLWGEPLRVGVEVTEQPFKVGGCGLRCEGGAAPMVQEGSG